MLFFNAIIQESFLGKSVVGVPRAGGFSGACNLILYLPEYNIWYTSDFIYINIPYLLINNRYKHMKRSRGQECLEIDIVCRNSVFYVCGDSDNELINYSCFFYN